MLKKKQLTARQLVEKCGGVQKVTELCQFATTAGVYNWFLRNRDIPKHWRILLESKVKK